MKPLATAPGTRKAFNKWSSLLVRAATRVRSNRVTKHVSRKSGGSTLTFCEACHSGDVSCRAGKGTWVGRAGYGWAGSSPLLDPFILASKGVDGEQK